MHHPHLQITQMFEEVGFRSGSGLIFVDANGDIAWMDDNTRRSVDGELRKLKLPVSGPMRTAHGPAASAY